MILEILEIPKIQPTERRVRSMPGMGARLNVTFLNVISFIMPFI